MNKMNDVRPDHERMIKTLAADDAAMARRVGSRILHGAGLTADMVSNLCALFPEPASMFAAVGAKITATILDEAASHLQSTGVDPDYGKSGASMLYGIAQEAGMRSKEAQGIWKRLLLNAMDPTFNHDIRLEDVRLLKSLNPSECVLIYLLGNHASDLRDAFIKRPFMSGARSSLGEFASNNLAQVGFQIRDIRTMANLYLGGNTTIPESEFAYSLLSRNGSKIHELFTIQNTSESNPVIFYTTVAIQDETVYTITQRNPVPTQYIDELEGTFAAKLTPMAQRLSGLLAQHSPK